MRGTTKKMLVRTVVAGLVMLNGILVMIGFDPLPFDEDQVTQGVSAATSAAAVAWIWFKNNSTTEEAKKADDYKDDLKRDKKARKRREKDHKKEGDK